MKKIDIFSKIMAEEKTEYYLHVETGIFLFGFYYSANMGHKRFMLIKIVGFREYFCGLYY